MTRMWYVGIFGKSGRINKYHDLGTLRINDVSGNLIFHASEKVRIGTNTDPATQRTRHVSWSRYLTVCSYFRKIRVRIIISGPRHSSFHAVLATAWNEQFRGIYGTVIFHDTRRILYRNATYQETWCVIECRVPDTYFAACQDKSRPGYVKCSVSREIRALILNGTDLLNEWAKLLHFDAHFLRTRTGS